MLAPQYTITTPIGEECHHLKFFDKEIDSQATIPFIAFHGKLTFITLKNKTTFWLPESQWISIQREIKLNKLIK